MKRCSEIKTYSQTLSKTFKMLQQEKIKRNAVERTENEGEVNDYHSNIPYKRHSLLQTGLFGLNHLKRKCLCQ